MLDIRSAATTTSLGVVNILVFGDMHQMGPVQYRILCKSVGRAADASLVEANLGHRFWREFITVVELVEQCGHGS